MSSLHFDRVHVTLVSVQMAAVMSMITKLCAKKHTIKAFAHVSTGLPTYYPSGISPMVALGYHAGEAELKMNPRSRSAKLRIVEKLDGSSSSPAHQR